MFKQNNRLRKKNGGFHIPGTLIEAGAEVIVGIRADAAAKAWGAWDDFTLYQVN